MIPKDKTASTTVPLGYEMMVVCSFFAGTGERKVYTLFYYHSGAATDGDGTGVWRIDNGGTNAATLMFGEYYMIPKEGTLNYSYLNLAMIVDAFVGFSTASLIGSSLVNTANDGSAGPFRVSGVLYLSDSASYLGGRLLMIPKERGTLNLSNVPDQYISFSNSEWTVVYFRMPWNTTDDEQLLCGPFYLRLDLGSQGYGGFNDS